MNCYWRVPMFPGIDSSMVTNSVHKIQNCIYNIFVIHLSLSITYFSITAWEYINIMKVVNKLCVKLFYCTKIFHWLKYIIFENMNIVGLQYKLLLLTHPSFPHPEAVFSYSIFSTTSFFSHVTVCDRCCAREMAILDTARSMCVILCSFPMACWRPW